MMVPSSSTKVGIRCNGLIAAYSGVLVLHGSNVDLFGRNRDAFFGKKNARPARVWCDFAVVELHSRLPSQCCLSLDQAEHGEKLLSKGTYQSLTRLFRSLLSSVLRFLRNAADCLSKCLAPIDADHRRTTRSCGAAAGHISGEAAPRRTVCTRGV